LLLSAGACSRYRSTAGTSAALAERANAGSVLLRAEERGSTQAVLFLEAAASAAGKSDDLSGSAEFSGNVY